jgi:hypothetical protein
MGTGQEINERLRNELIMKKKLQIPHTGAGPVEISTVANKHSPKVDAQVFFIKKIGLMQILESPESVLQQIVNV